MSKNRRLKAFVRYDGTGRAVPSSVILAQSKPKVGNWKEIDAYECCNSQPPQPIQALRLTFDSIENADLLVGDSSDVSDWNTFFDLPTYGNPFTSVEVVGNEVRLFGGSNIKVKPGLMYNPSDNTYELLSIDDQAECITSVGGDAFSYCYGLTDVNLPACTIIYGPEDSPFDDNGGFGGCIILANFNAPLLEEIGTRGLNGNLLTVINFPQLTTAGSGCFQSCTSLTTINLPSCQNLGGTVGDNGVFFNISGNNITLTVPSALMTADAGNPDGDIVYLQANNTVTVITV